VTVAFVGAHSQTRIEIFVGLRHPVALQAVISPPEGIQVKMSMFVITHLDCLLNIEIPRHTPELPPPARRNGSKSHNDIYFVIVI